MKRNLTGQLVLTLLFLLLCLLAQLLENVSVYLSESLVCAFAVLTTLLCGYHFGVFLCLLTPLTGWLATGSTVISAYPQILPFQALANLLLISLVWFFVRVLSPRLSKAEFAPSGSHFRLVALIAVTAAVLWASLCTAFLSAASELLQMESVSPLLLVALIAILGSLALLLGLWTLVCRFPRAWPYLAGGILGSGGKFLVMWLLVSRLTLANATETAAALARSAYGVPQLFAALLGSALGILLWLPLGRFLEKGGGKNARSGH